MEAENEENVWTGDKFIALKTEFLAARSEVAAFDVLQRLVVIEQGQIDENAWLDCKDLILVLLENIPVEMMLLRQQMALLQAVNHAPPHVIATLANFYAKKNVATPLLRKEAVAISVAFARRLNHTETFEAVASLLAPLASQQEVRGELFHQLTTARDSEHRFRIYQVLAATLRQNTYDESLHPFFDVLIQDLTHSDILTQLATMDLLADLAIINRRGAELLNETGVIEKVQAILSNGADSPDGGFLYTAAIKFFGCLAHCYPDVIDSVPIFVDLVLNMVMHIGSLDAMQRILAAETFAHLVYTTEGKKKVERGGSTGQNGIPDALASLCQAIRSGPVELRARVIDSITTAFENFADDEHFSQWLAYMPDLPGILTTYVERPFPETRQATIRLLGLILARQRGVEVMLSDRENIEAFKEWLCDPASESEWVACQQKNDLIRTFRAVNWPGVDVVIKEQLKHYFDAPKGHPEVATMEL